MYANENTSYNVLNELKGKNKNKYLENNMFMGRLMISSSVK